MKKAIALINNKKYEIHVTEDELEKSKGLMFKSPPIHPLAFPYEYSGYLRFWMKNTIAPLDIVFCHNNKIISIEEGIPLNTRPVGPNKLCDLVIEFNKDFVKEEKIKVGDKIFIIAID
jgi:hypothetical protein